MAAAATILAPTTFSFWNPLEEASKAETDVITESFELFELFELFSEFDDILGSFDEFDALGDLDDLDDLDCRTLVLLAIICALVLRLVRARRVVTGSVSAMQTCKRANTAREKITCFENVMVCKSQ